MWSEMTPARLEKVTDPTPRGLQLRHRQHTFIKIVFHNADNRFTMENSNKIIVCQTIGQKKDKFFTSASAPP